MTSSSPLKQPDEIREALVRFDKVTAQTLGEVRNIVHDVAKSTDNVGRLTETLKWGEPAFLTEQTKSGSTLRLGQTKSGQQPALFVNCQTNLIEQFRELYPETFDYEGKRALVLKKPISQTEAELRHCIALTLTYHLRKRRILAK